MFLQNFSGKSPRTSNNQANNETESENLEGKIWKKQAVTLLDEINKVANVLSNMIAAGEANLFKNTCHRPMDMATIKKGIENGTLKNINQVERDVKLLLLNAAMFNPMDSKVERFELFLVLNNTE